MCPVTAPEKGKHRGLDLQKFPVFCSALFNIPGKNPKICIHQKSAQQPFVERIIGTVAPLEPSCKTFSPIRHIGKSLPSDSFSASGREGAPYVCCVCESILV